MRTRDQEKYDAIVRSSIKLINELGFEGISISKIAREARVSPATIYIYFENKEDLFTKIYIDIRKKMSQGTLEGLQEDMGIEQAFKSIWHRSFTFNLQHPEYVVYREQFEQTAMMAYIIEDEFELFQTIRTLLQRGVEDQVVMNVPLPILVSFAFVPIITLVKFHIEGIVDMNEKQIEQACGIAWKAIVSSID